MLHFKVDPEESNGRCGARLYFGVGATYEDYALIDSGTFVEDTGWGANLVLGSRTQTLTMFRPFGSRSAGP